MEAPRPRYAYEDPAALAWGAQLIRTGHKRRLLRLAAEQAAQTPDERDTRAEQPITHRAARGAS